jgi:hypothetical protein
MAEVLNEIASVPERPKKLGGWQRKQLKAEAEANYWRAVAEGKEPPSRREYAGVEKRIAKLLKERTELIRFAAYLMNRLEAATGKRSEAWPKM